MYICGWGWKISSGRRVKWCGFLGLVVWVRLSGVGFRFSGVGLLGLVVWVFMFSGVGSQV